MARERKSPQAIELVMCGIAGIVSESAGRSKEQVRTMLSRLAHRGPDDEGIHSLHGAMLGARRLAIIDLVRGNQPMLNEDGSVVAVQNGEIYNFRQLRADLERAGHRFTTDNDTEILPHAYEEWGIELVERLRGMFAIALWDDRRRRLVLARDRYGKKPMYYALVDGGIAFASEIQALLTHPRIERSIDETAIANYLALGYVPAPATGFAAIAKVPPAHLLEFSDGTVRTRRYWHLPMSPKIELSLDDAADRLCQELDTAVQLRLISDVPLGAFLSGGLDSSTVVSFMARHSTKPVKTFSIGFRDQGLNELPYARIVARAFSTDHHELIVDAAETDVLPMLARHVGEPFADSSIVPTYHVARITRREVTVALNGDGGDEAFAGYDRYSAALLADRVGRLPGPLVHLAARAARALPIDGARAISRARRFAEPLALSWHERYMQWVGYFVGGNLERIVGERLKGNAIDPGQLLRESAEQSGACDPVERVMAADVATYLPGDLLVKMDRATMAASLEARSPFLDHELGQFAARLPRDQKLIAGKSKIVLRHAMRNVLPQETLNRSKRGFGAPVGAWLRGPLRELVHTMVLRPSPDSGLVNRQRASELYTELDRGRLRNAPLIWNLLMLELWYRECVIAK